MLSQTELAAWPHTYRPGTARKGHDGPVLLMLHGTGSSEHDILNLADEIDPTATVISPRGQVTEGGALRWFRRLAEGVFDVEDVIRRAGELAEFVGWATDAYDLRGRGMVAVGFSNGANMALATGILSPGLFDTTIAFSGMYPFADRPISTELSGQHFILLNGDSDAMAPASSVDRLSSELERSGADVARHSRPGGHGITAEELGVAREAYAAAALSRERRDTAHP